MPYFWHAASISSGVRNPLLSLSKSSKARSRFSSRMMSYELTVAATNSP